jgi:predicted SPOUT superfamily RNA methylase MTH1
MRRGCEFVVAVPASFVSDVPHLREKSLKVGLVGRAAAIFRVDEIVVFPDLLDVDQRQDARLISVILSYMETPQYLRKRLFRIRPELRYAGVLPPLRTPHHPLGDRVADLRVGELREGVVESLTKARALVDIGVERPVVVSGAQLEVNKRVTVKITELGRRVRAVVVSRGEVGEYWGYRVRVSDVPFGGLVRVGGFDLVVATSRYGVPFVEVKEGLARRWREADRILVAFGAPSEGLREIVEREGLKLEEVADFVVNMVSGQGVETVRTEEAVFICLGLLNCL